MIKSVTPYGMDNAWCEHCKKRCNTPERSPFLVTSTNKKESVILCNACIDMALFETGILPEDF